jgi:hypothetical protein
MLASLGKSRLIDDPDLRIAEQVDHLMGQTPLDLFHFPGALPHELSQCLHVCAGDARRQRLNRFAFPVQQQALNINPSPMAPLAAAHGFQQVFEKTQEATFKAFQALRCHAGNVAHTALTSKNYLT